MGRFYKTATPNKIDFMHKLPEQAILQSIQATDQRLGQEEAAIYDLYGQLQANALSDDKTRRDEILKGYEGSVDELARQFQENPLAYSATKGKTRKLAREIHEDWTRGEISAIQGNFNARTEFVKRYKEAIAAGKEGYNAKDFEQAMQYFDSKFQGTNYDQELGKGASYTTEELSKYINIEDIAETRGDGYISDAIKDLKAFEKDGYIYTSVDSKEFVKPEVIRDGVISAMMNDTELMDYLKQQAKFGRYGDNPEEYIKKSLTAAANRVAEKYGFEKKEEGLKSMTGDPFALKRLDHELAKDMYGWKKNFDNLAEMPVDRTNEEVKYDIFAGSKTKEDFENKTKELEASNEQMTQQIKNNMYEKIISMQKTKGEDGQPLLSASEATEMFNAINTAVKNGNWNEVEQLYSKVGIGTVDSEGNIIGTGVQEMVDQMQQNQKAIDNNNQIMTSLENNISEELDKEFDQRKADATANLNKSIDDLNAQIEKMGTLEGLSTKEAIAKNTKINKLRLERDQKIKARDNLTKKMQEEYNKVKDQRVEAGINSVLGNEEVSNYYQSVYSTAGNYFDDMGMDDVQKANFLGHLESAGKNIFESLSNASNGYVEYVEMVDGKRVTKRLNYNELAQSGMISFKAINIAAEAKEGEEIKIVEGGKEITFKKGDMRQVPHSLPGLGRFAYQQTIVGTDPKTGKPRTYTFYVPQSDMPPAEDVYRIQQKALPKILTEELVLEGQRTWETLIKKDKVKPNQAVVKSAEANVKYMPYVSDPNSNVVGKWEFVDDNGDIQVMYGNAGRDMYMTILEAKYGQARLDGDELRGTNINKGSGATISTTRSR